MGFGSFEMGWPWFSVVLSMVIFSTIPSWSASLSQVVCVDASVIMFSTALLSCLSMGLSLWSYSTIPVVGSSMPLAKT